MRVIFCATQNLRISEIAFAAGFQSLSQFNRVFKRFSGKSPTQYRAAEAMRRQDRQNSERRVRKRPKKCVVIIFCFCAYSPFVWRSRLTRWIHGKRESLFWGAGGAVALAVILLSCSTDQSNNSRSAQHPGRGVRRLRGMRDLPRTDRARFPNSHSRATADKKGNRK